MPFFRARSRAQSRRHDYRRSMKPLSTASRKLRRPGIRFRPVIDTLEGRALLSTATVTNTNDSGPGSLRDAIDNAISGEVINFAKTALGTIHLTSGPLFVDMIDLTILGPGPDKLTISGGGNSTVLDFLSVFPPSDPAPP